MSQTTSPSLLIRIRNPQDQSAWQEFDELYSEIIRLYCRQRKLQSHDEDDVVQDVMNSVSTAIRNLNTTLAKVVSGRGWEQSPPIESGII